MTYPHLAMEEKHVLVIGWFASFMALAMYFSYIDQIQLNLAGQKGSSLLPLATCINCLAWTTYGMLKRNRDWPLIICNIPGVILGLVTLVTSL